MRNLCIVAALALVVSLSAHAADEPTLPATGVSVPLVEVFAGASFMRLDTSPASLAGALNQPLGTVTVKQNYLGWNGAAQLNVTRWLGIVADASGYYGTPFSAPASTGLTGFPKANFYNFLFGPSFNFRGKRAKPFVHALFGFNHVGVDASTALGTPGFTDDAFAMALGGGLDVRVSNHISIRPVQADFLYTRHDTTGFRGVGHQNNFRYSGGLVFSFGCP